MARLRLPVDHPDTQEFTRALEPINLLADVSPGFVWQLKGPEGQDDATEVRLPGDEDPLLIINLTVWEDLESLHHFAYRSGHAMYIRRKRDWFVSMDEEQTVLYWVPEGHIPTVEESAERLWLLRRDGPSRPSPSRAPSVRQARSRQARCPTPCIPSRDASVARGSGSPDRRSHRCG